jgi:hypothetical protein
MKKSKIVVGFIILLYLGFVVFQFKSNEYWATALDALLLPLITIAYFQDQIKPNLYFSIFLICYSVSDLMVFIVDFIPYRMYYYIGNSIYILAYFALLTKILKSLSLSYIFRNFKLHLIVLAGLNIYIGYVLQNIVNPYLEINLEYFIEMIYNVSMLLVLSASLLNYFYRDNRKSLLIFLGSLAIVFSEVIGVAYMYVAGQNLLGFLSTSLTVLAFYFYYKQATLNNEEVNGLVSSNE